MSDFVDGFTLRLDGKIPDNELRIVRDELELYVEKWKQENGHCYLAVPDEAIPNEYKEWIVTMKLEGKSAGTIKAYNATMVPFFITVQMQLKDISTQAIKAYLLHYGSVPHGNCSEPCGPHTLEIMRLELSSFFSWCVDNGKLEANPMRGIRPIRYEKKPIDVLTPLELSRVKFSCKTTRERAIIEAFYSTGCRVGELCKIKKTDVEWENANRHGIVPVNVIGKGNKHRKVYLNADANIAVKKYLAERADDSEYLFTTGRGEAKQMTVRSMQQIVKAIGDRAGVKGLHPHELRHTRATDFVRESGSLLLTSKMLGHASVQTTEKYYIVTDDSELEHEISRFC